MSFAPRLTAMSPAAAFLAATLFLDTAVFGEPISVVRVAEGLNQPLAATHAPGVQDRLFIAEKGGTIRTLDLTTNTVSATPLLTIPGLLTTNERGLIGLAFDPDFASNGHFYVNVIEPGGASNVGVTAIRRYTMVGNPLTSNTVNTNPTTIMKFDQTFANHNGGWMDFSPVDGHLYIASGDGGSGNDPNNAGQRLNTHLGKMLRIDPSGDDFPTDPNRNYRIPTDNPFVGVSGALDEIWAYGLRNPFRNSFDRLTGDLIIADVGQQRREEINFQPADSAGGENYGWRLREGTIATPNVGGAAPAGAIDPVYDYAHGNGTFQGDSVTGGYVYRGLDPALQGKYIFGDFVNGNVWAMTIDSSVDPTLFDGTNFSDLVRLNGDFEIDFGAIDNVASFGEDSAGNLYLVDFDGDIFRIGSATAVPEPSLLALGAFVTVVLAGRRRRHPVTLRRKAP
ncbi:MAG: PQQ-dependent sugar dehydrogenase [Planctomycetota bacterium]